MRRVQLNVVPGKGYTEEVVKIIADSESLSDQSFVSVGKSSFIEDRSERDESDLFSLEGN